MSITIAKHQKTTIVLSLLLAFTCVLLLHSKVSAATINVSTGTDTVEDDSICQLSEAITNINDQDTTYDDCTPTGSYGTDDVINVPTGTITLTDNLPEIEQSISVQGQGMGQTIINGGGYRVFWSEEEDLGPGAELSFHGMTITGFANAAIFSQGSANVNISEIEVDGENSVTDPDLYGIYVMNDTSSENSVNISDVYIHNYDTNYSSIHTFAVGGAGGGITHADINRVTIDDIHNTGGINVMLVANGIFGGTFQSHTTDAIVQNVSLSNISSNSAIAAFGGDVITSTGSSDVDITANNITISNIDGQSSVYGNTSGLISAAGALGPSATADARVSATNVIVSDVFANGERSNCTVLDLNPGFSGAGTVNVSLTSSGGNLSDDSSCNDYFTHPTDQTELTNLADSLGSLSDNGGLIPTIPLLEDSPAIDAGVEVEGLLTDARGVSRPQCYAYDPGAYEYDGENCPEPLQDTIALPTQSPNNTTSYLILPQGVTNASFSTADTSTVPTDTAYSFPAGLVSFQFDTDTGATETIVLYFDLPGDPSSYTARKYDTNNHSFSTIPNATVTRETYNNQSLIKLTYNITDGDNLDQDHTINGTIIDPVGLGTQTTTTPNTGLAQYWLLGLRG